MKSTMKGGRLMLQWGRRNYPAETSKCQFCGSREATASMGPPELPGGNDSTDLAAARAEALQWGRRNYPAETCGRSSASRRRSRSLQWGRRNYPAETAAPPACLAGASSFNGAAGITRRKPECYSTGLPRHRARFNGAAGITRRKQLHRQASSDHRRVASMGPPELPGGNRLPTPVLP